MSLLFCATIWWADGLLVASSSDRSFWNNTRTALVCMRNTTPLDTKRNWTDWQHLDTMASLIFPHRASILLGTEEPICNWVSSVVSLKFVIVVTFAEITSDILSTRHRACYTCQHCQQFDLIRPFSLLLLCSELQKMLQSETIWERSSFGKHQKSHGSSHGSGVDIHLSFVRKSLHRQLPWWIPLYSPYDWSLLSRIP
jgi:hypothetical protein